jgi:Uma2 family endonuclease
MSVLQHPVAESSPRIVPLTVDQYHEMIAKGILNDGDSIELIDGVLVRKDRAERGGDPMSHGPGHRAAISAMQECLDGVKAAGCHVGIQLPVTLGRVQEPEPDLAVIRGRPKDFSKRHPGPADIVALIEVADSSLNVDRTTKLRLYANAAIAVYWIVSLVDRQVEVYEDPRPGEGEYRRHTDYKVNQTVVLSVAAGVDVVVPVAAVLPA